MMSYAMMRPVLAGMILVAAVGAAAAAQRNPVPAATKPQRIVSLNLCTDQLLLALADRSQIAGLTHNAKDPAMSAAAAEVGAVHVMGESAEELLLLDPDLVVGMPARRRAAMGALAAQNYRTLDLKSAESYAAILEQIRTVAAAVGHPERGEALVARMNAQLAALPKVRKGGVAAYYQRRGYLTGTGTLVDDLMARTGLTNLAAKMGKPMLSQMSLEEMMAAQPDYLIVESATDRVVDQGTEMLHHPILKDIPRISLPQAWTVCGGPAYVLAARSIVAQVDGFGPKRGQAGR